MGVGPMFRGAGQAFPKVSGGIHTLHGEFPHQVQLTYNGGHFCGGTVISSLLILTAAHCLVNKQKERMRVVAGEYRRSFSDLTEQYRRVEQMILHEGYNPRTHENDIALIELETELEFNSFTTSVLVPKDLSLLNKMAETTGWGQVPELSINLAHALRKVTVEIHNDSVCTSKWGSTYKPGMICAGSGNRDTCGGDSGGPVTCNHLLSPSKKFVCGITSFGVKNCGNPQYPGVYTDVSFYYSWIMRKMMTATRRRVSCPVGYAQCSNLQCIPESSLCDNFDDCGDRSDEYPSHFSCRTKQFQCSSTGERIEHRFRCDRVIDCRDGSDERDCDYYNGNSIQGQSETEGVVNSPSLSVGGGGGGNRGRRHGIVAKALNWLVNI